MKLKLAFAIGTWVFLVHGVGTFLFAQLGEKELFFAGHDLTISLLCAIAWMMRDGQLRERKQEEKTELHTRALLRWGLFNLKETDHER